MHCSHLVLKIFLLDYETSNSVFIICCSVKGGVILLRENVDSKWYNFFLVSVTKTLAIRKLHIT